ncbi:hypothetical protein KUCAC02_025434, partial [Chaenocephalus aceratus]
FTSEFREIHLQWATRAKVTSRTPVSRVAAERGFTTLFYCFVEGLSKLKVIITRVIQSMRMYGCTVWERSLCGAGLRLLSTSPLEGISDSMLNIVHPASCTRCSVPGSRSGASCEMTMILTTERRVVNKTSHYPLLS